MPTYSNRTIPSNKPGIYSGTMSPTDFLAWINERFTQAAKIKGTVLSADDLIKVNEATDLEIANLAFIELTSMGYICKFLYIETVWSGRNHTVVLFRDAENRWRWFDWKNPKDCGVYGPFTSMTEVVIAVKALFDSFGFPHKFSGIGEKPLEKTINFEEYHELVRHWRRPPRRKLK